MTFTEVLHQHYGNFIAAGFLIVLLFVMFTTNRIFTFRSKLFLFIIIFSIVENIMEPIVFAAENRGTVYYNLLAYSLMYVLFFFAPIVAGLFGSYIDYLIHQSRERLKKRMYYMQPALIITILLLMNFITPIIFSYDQAGVYSRGSLYNLMFVAITGMYSYIMVMAAKYQKQLHTKILLGSSLYLFGPVLAAIIQLYFLPNVLLMHPAIAMATVFGYLLFESNNGSVEPFTKLMTRDRFSIVINDLLANNDEFSLILFDINKFKQINDQFGHVEGDKALLYFSRALVEVYGMKSSIARFGGDEFAVCLDTVARIHITLFEQHLKDFLAVEHGYVFEPLTFSMGYTIRDSGDQRTVDELYHAADLSMYNNKSNILRRRTDIVEVI